MTPVSAAMQFSRLSYDPPRTLGIKSRVVGVFRWKEIISDVASRHGLTVAELTGAARSRWIAWPRFEAMHRLRTELGWSLPQIGRRLGDRDHTTILSGLRRYEKLETQEWLAVSAARHRLRVRAAWPPTM